MSIREELTSLSPSQDSVLSIGVFDGVHLGHRRLIARLIEESAQLGLVPGIVTFRGHPESVVTEGSAPRLLSSLDERINLLKGLGISLVVPVTFDEALSKLQAREFVSLLQQTLRMRALVVGPDFALGYKREGDVAKLTSLGRELGYSVSIVGAAVSDDGNPITSTAVREALGAGDVERVASLMGRQFSLWGEVVTGEGRGATLGFPTANLMTEGELAVPGDGIYATWAYAGGERFMAAASIGVRPTFADAGRAVEAFLLEFRGDLYGQRLRLEFVRRLRDERKFDDVVALQRQVDEDVIQTREILARS